MVVFGLIVVLGLLSGGAYFYLKFGYVAPKEDQNKLTDTEREMLTAYFDKPNLSVPDTAIMSMWNDETKLGGNLFSFNLSLGGKNISVPTFKDAVKKPNRSATGFFPIRRLLMNDKDSVKIYFDIDLLLIPPESKMNNKSW